MKRRSFLGALAAPAVAAVIPLDDFRPATPKPGWIADELQPCTDFCDAARPTDPFLIVDTPEIHRLGDMIHVPRTGENMWITGVKGSRISVVRGIGKPACRLEQNELLYTIGSFERIP